MELTRKDITEEYLKGNIGRIYNRLGYKFYSKPFYLNIFGVRLETNTDKFDDVICVVYFDNQNKMHINIFNAATDPGKKYLANPMNPKGTAILVPGQYKNTWKKGPHGKSKYTALRQAASVKVYRDNDRNLIHDLNSETIDEGIFWINIHRAEKWKVRENIGPYSAGCQVIQDIKDFDKLMELVDLSIDKAKVNRFTYTLFTRDEFTDYGTII